MTDLQSHARRVRSMWNYRLLKLKDGLNRPLDEVYEVYYDDNDQPRAWAESHNLLAAETREELKETYEYMVTAFEQPILKIVENKLVEADEECGEGNK